jgi:hypothetical protein
MIWGLGVDRPSGAGEPPQPAIHKESGYHQNIPPRLQKQDNSNLHPLLASLPSKTSAEADHYPQVIHQTTLGEFEYPSQFNETIDLSRLLAQSHLQDTSNLMHSVALNDSTPVNRVLDEKPVYNRSENRHINWQSFVTQDRTRHSALAPTTNSASAAALVNPKPLVSTQPAPGSTRPVILLDSHSHSHSVSLPLPRRLSAIEIAQKFRQQQELLPTPPNSSSPQWSSDFSPYQESMLSPEAVFLSSLSPDLQLGIAQHLQRSAYERVTNSPNEVILAPLVPHIRSDVVDQTSENYSQGLHRHSRSHHLFPHSQNISASHTASTTHCHRPPNTPLSAVSRIGSDQRRGQPNIDATLSLTSSIQQPRSIPLSRLVQRRLSSVMETPEDHAGRSPSPPVFQQNLHLSRAVEPEIRATPNYANDSSHGKSTAFMERDARRSNGDESRRLSAFEQIKAQLYGADFVDVRNDGRQTGERRMEHKDNRGLDVNGDNGGGKARHVGFKPQVPFKRKMRGKKKNGSAGENAPIAN